MLTGNELIFGYADELIAEQKAKWSKGLPDFASLEWRLADTLEKIVRYLREERDG